MRLNLLKFLTGVALILATCATGQLIDLISPGLTIEATAQSLGAGYSNAYAIDGDWKNVYL